MKASSLVLAAALAFGFGGGASAAPTLPNPADIIKRPDVTVEYVKRGRGRHSGWHKSRRVYYVGPRRHYGWHKPSRIRYVAPRRYYGYYPARRYYGYYPSYYSAYPYRYHKRPRVGVYFHF
jgi:hypothetical protein